MRKDRYRLWCLVPRAKDVDYHIESVQFQTQCVVTNTNNLNKVGFRICGKDYSAVPEVTGKNELEHIPQCRQLDWA